MENFFQKQSSSENGKKAGGFLHRFFRYLLSKIGLCAKASEKKSVPLKERVITPIHRSDLEKKCKECIARIEAEKKGLLADAGTLADSFFTRYVDPFVRPLRSFLKENTKNPVTVFEIESVLHDEEHLRDKIEANLLHQTKTVLAEDEQFIQSFSRELLHEAHIKTYHSDVILLELAQLLRPFLERLKNLGKFSAPKKTLLELFQWKLEVDGERQKILDQAICVIEDTVRLWRKTGDLFSKTKLEDQIAYISNILSSIHGEVKMPEALFDLEEASFYLTRLVDGSPILVEDERILKLIYGLKEHVDHLFDEAKRMGHYDVLLRMIEHLRYIDDRVSEKDAEKSVEIAPPEVLP